VLVGDAFFRLNFALKVTHSPLKNADFDRFPLITSQLYCSMEHASRGLSAIAELLVTAYSHATHNAVSMYSVSRSVRMLWSQLSLKLAVTVI